MYVGMYGDIVHVAIDICVYPNRRHAYRWVHVYLSPSIHPNIYVYGHPSIFRYMHLAHVSPCCAAGAAACARGALQVDPLHEGEGAPRVARPVQALGVPVRPAAAVCLSVCMYRYRYRLR
jgi:hypothetical protein